MGEKIYEVEFMSYTNCMKNTISNGEDDVSKLKYIHIGNEPFLVRESELDKYSKYGEGFRTIKFVGHMVLPSIDNCRHITLD